MFEWHKNQTTEDTAFFSQSVTDKMQNGCASAAQW